MFKFRNADTKRPLFGVVGVSDDRKRCVFGFERSGGTMPSANADANRCLLESLDVSDAMKRRVFGV